MYKFSFNMVDKVCKDSVEWTLYTYIIYFSTDVPSLISCTSSGLELRMHISNAVKIKCYTRKQSTELINSDEFQNDC